jgi:hypothetical protein
LWGEGEIGLTVYSILVRYWEFTKRTTGLPLILLMSVTATPENSWSGEKISGSKS